MAERIAEVMNREVLRFEPDAPARAALQLLLRMGLSAAPVVDAEDRPLGVVSLRDLAAALEGTKVSANMRSPALVVSPSKTLLDAARLLDEANLHHLTVVDAELRVVGFVSSLDLLRAIIGAPVRHPESFVHWDDAAGAAFSNDHPLDGAHAVMAPHTPGLVVIVRGGAGRPERVAWVEPTLDIQRWLLAYLDADLKPGLAPDDDGASFAVRYRYAQIDDARVREAAAEAVRAGAGLGG